MSNKLPWFTHDHDAHEDAYIRNLVRKQGHVGGWLYWVLIELHHKHGVGDVMKRNMGDVAKAGLTSTSVLRRVLTEMATEFEGESKVRWKEVGTELELEIPKLRERQAKMKSKIPAKLRQPSANPPQKKREKEKENKHTKSPNGDRVLTDVQRVVKTYKQLIGVDTEDKEWDRIQFPVCAGHAKRLISLWPEGNGDFPVNKAIDYMKKRAEIYQESNVGEWSIAAVVRAASTEKARVEAEEGRVNVPR